MSLNSDEIFDIIETIGKNSSKNAKENLIAGAKFDDHFCKVLEAALNPFITYGLAKRPTHVAGSDGLFNDHTYAILNALASRQLSGNEAINAVVDEMGRLSRKSAELFWRIITKDLRAGFSESTVNKAIPGLIATFDCMLAHKYDPSRIKVWPQIAEPKLDGVRVLAFVDFGNSRVNFFSRSGKEYFTFEHLKVPLLEALGDTHFNSQQVFDGEIVSGSFNKTVSEVRKKDSQATDAIFHIFDMLDMAVFKAEDKKGAGDTYTVRRARLTELLADQSVFSQLKLVPRYLVNSQDEISGLYERVQARGLEGLIIKDPNGLYHRRRNHAWMKIKAEESVDVEIIGYEEGTGKYEGQLGALIVDFNGVRVNVGSGLVDGQRSSFWDAKDELVGRLIEVEYHEITPDGSLRHPRFKRFRDDKLKEAA